MVPGLYHVTAFFKQIISNGLSYFFSYPRCTSLSVQICIWWLNLCAFLTFFGFSTFRLKLSKVHGQTLASLSHFLFYYFFTCSSFSVYPYFLPSFCPLLLFRLSFSFCSTYIVPGEFSTKHFVTRHRREHKILPHRSLHKECVRETTMVSVILALSIPSQYHYISMAK